MKSQTLDYINPLLMEIKQEMFKSNGELASELMMKVGVFDIAQRKLIKPTQEWLKAIGVS